MASYEEDRGQEAEAAVLGSMLIEPQAIRRALLHLRAEDFKDEGRRAVFRAIEALYEQDHDGGVDLVTVAERLNEDRTIDVVGGMGGVAALVDKVTTAAHVEHYAKLVRNASLARQITAQFRATYEDQTPENMRALQDLMMSKEGNLASAMVDFRTDLQSIIDEILRTDVPLIKTGFDRLDALLCGLEPGELVTVGARTAGGKTAFMLRTALQMAEYGNEVLYITSEMRVKELVKRILPQATRIPAWKFRSRSLNERERDKVRLEGIEKLSTLPLKMMARGRISIEDIRRAVIQSGCKVVFVDYLQRCKLPKAERESSALYDFMANYKELLLDTGTLGFIASQLDRQRDKEPDKRPTLSEFRGSGGIEAESDTAIMLWKPVPKPDRMDYVPPPQGQVRVEAVIAKARSGVSDVGVDMNFDGDFVRFAEASLNSQEEERWT